MVSIGIGIGVPHQGTSGAGGGIPSVIPEGIQPLATAANLRAGARFSTNLATPDLLIAANTPDRWQLGGVWEASSVQGATNLVPSDMAVWTLSNDGTTPAVVRADQGSGVWRFTFQIVGGSTWGSMAEFAFGGSPIGGAQGFSGFTYRVISGTAADLTMKYATGTPAADAIVSFNDDGNWHEAKGYPNTARSTNQFQLRGTTDGGSGTVQTLVIEVKRMRCVDNLTACPGFPDYGAAGATFGSDRMSVPDPLLASTAEIASSLVPYDWGAGALSLRTRPNSGARLWNFQSGMQPRLSGSLANRWFFDDGVNVTFDATMSDGGTTSVFCNWDGVTNYAEGVPGTSSSMAANSSTGGTLHLGNNAGGTRDMGAAAMAILLYNRHLTAGERTTIADYLGSL